MEQTVLRCQLMGVWIPVLNISNQIHLRELLSALSDQKTGRASTVLPIHSCLPRIDQMIKTLIREAAKSHPLTLKELQRSTA